MRRLKIIEQLLIVFFIAVLLPLCVATLIIINVNQLAVRKEIRYSAYITADNVYQRLINSIEKKKLAILYAAKSFTYLNSYDQISKLKKELLASSGEISNVEIINRNNNAGYNPDFTASNVVIVPDVNKKVLKIYAKLSKKLYLKESIEIKKLEKDVFKNIHNEKRQIYIIDSKNNIIMAYNRNNSTFKEIIPDIPKKIKQGEPFLFGKAKNRPHIFIKLNNPDCSIVVVTPKNLTRYGIEKARFKIIYALIVAALAIIIIGVWYSISLNTNLRQLLKTISAIGQGNFKKRVRLIRGFLAPQEIGFLADEFNYMAQKIDDSYEELQLANEKLSKIDEMKSNLIDTVSHEFRTPLTCIKGYTSRLLRGDIIIDEDTKVKSLKVIKQQTERLSRLVEDLLVIPDIESSLIRLFPDHIDLRNMFENCILSIQQKQARSINLQIAENVTTAYADPDRVEQVIINLLDNAQKYSPEGSEIDVNVCYDEENVVIRIHNECEPVSNEALNTLFGKFTRLDENLTRTTRGTGLGLFIAKGLIGAMGGNISLSSENGFEVCLTLPLNP